MKCDEYKIHLIDFLYNEMSAEDEGQLKTHLKICEGCRREYEELRTTGVLLRSWPDEDPGPSLVFVREAGGFLHNLRHLVWPSPAPLWKKLLAGAATAAAAMLVVAAFFNFELSSVGDRLSLRTSLLPRPQMTADFDSTIVHQLREQNLQLISELLLASREQQRQEMARTLAQFAQEVHRQRANDLLLVGRGLEQVQQRSDSRFQRTDEVLNSLIRTVRYQPQE